MTIAALLASLVSSTAESRADPTYSGSAQAMLTLDSISGGSADSLIALPLVNDDTVQSTTGGGFVDMLDASATTTFVPITPAAGNSISLDSVIGGGVSGPSGTSSSLASSTGGLSIFNNSTTDTLTLSFTFNYGYRIQAATTGPLQSSSASAIVSLRATTNLGDQDANLFFSPTATASNSTTETLETTGFPSLLTFTFSVELSPGELASISTRADTNGMAEVLIPEPTSLTLIGLGLAAGIPLSLRTRRRVQGPPPRDA